MSAEGHKFDFLQVLASLIIIIEFICEQWESAKHAKIGSLWLLEIYAKTLCFVLCTLTDNWEKPFSHENSNLAKTKKNGEKKFPLTLLFSLILRSFKSSINFWGITKMIEFGFMSQLFEEKLYNKQKTKNVNN